MRNRSKHEKQQRGKNREDSISWQGEGRNIPAPVFFLPSRSIRRRQGWLSPLLSDEILDSCWCELWLRISSLARGFYEWITRGSSPSLLHSPQPLSTLWAFSALSGFRRPIEKRMSNDRAVGQLLIERSIWNPVGWSISADWRFQAAFTLTIEWLRTDRSEIEEWIGSTMEWLLCSVNLKKLVTRKQRLHRLSF